VAVLGYGEKDAGEKENCGCEDHEITGFDSGARSSITARTSPLCSGLIIEVGK
jgi:hypothetical protein